MKVVSWLIGVPVLSFIGLSTGGEIVYRYVPREFRDPVLLLYPRPCCSSRCGDERNASLTLKTITSAQADFRSNDRDGDGVNQFWRGDIAGLYALVPRDGGFPVKLIELSLAAADAAPQVDITPYAIRGPKSGYSYRALLHADERTPSPDRFAACAYPATPSAGKWTYIVDENNSVYRRPGIVTVTVFPTDDELRQFWGKFD